MTQRDWTAWLPPALLLLWLPGCVTLSGPRTVTGTEGGSLSMQCQYEEKFKENSKYWCRGLYITLCDNTVQTRGSKRETRRGRVSIKDHPAQLSFTVTMQDLTVEDEGSYWCGIDTSLFEDGRVWDPIFQVVVSVSPGLPVLSTVPVTDGATHSTSSQENSNQSLGLSLQVLLALVAVLSLLLTGASVVGWRMVRKGVKAAGNGEEVQNSIQLQTTEPSELCYANLELQTQPSEIAPKRRQDLEVLYSTVVAPKEELHYALVTFELQSQDSEPTSTLPERPQEEPEYSMIRKT